MSGPHFDFEREAIAGGCRWVAGVDEVGRGPLAGPVGVAAVILDPDDLPEGLDDSKALPEAQARRARGRSSSPRRSASRSPSPAPRRSTASTSAARPCASWRARWPPCTSGRTSSLIDGRDMPDGLICPARPIIGGDALSMSIAAASIVAKTTRDALMRNLGRDYPRLRLRRPCRLRDRLPPRRAGAPRAPALITGARSGCARTRPTPKKVSKALRPASPLVSACRTKTTQRQAPPHNRTFTLNPRINDAPVRTRRPLRRVVALMRTLRAGALRLPAQIQVLRTGAGETKRPAAIGPAPRDVILVGDCVAEMDEAAAGLGRSRLRRSALQSSARRRAVAARPERGRRGRRRLGQVRRFRRIRRVHAGRGSPPSAALMKPNATIVVIGSYHNIFRVGAILQDLGFWILNDIVWRKANPMPNFRGRRFTNAHETMIWAARGPEAKAYTFNYEALKAGNEDVSGALRLVPADLHRGGAAEGRDRAQAHPTQKPEALLAAGAARRLQRRRSGARSVLRLRHHRRGRAQASALLHRHRAGSGLTPRRRGRRIAAVEPLAEEAVAIAPTRRSEPRIAFASLVEAGLVAARRTVFDARRRHRRWCGRTARSPPARRSARSTRSARSCRGCPPATAGPSGMSSGPGG